MELIKQGAESRIYRIEHEGKPSILKERFPKKYRLPELDQQITKERIKGEIKALAKCKDAEICAPQVYHVDYEGRKIIMEDINGPTLKDILNRTELAEEINLENLAKHVGTTLSKMHMKNLIHGDLTTSNMLYNIKTDELYLIDFGLSCTSTNVEEKAVDLYVLERALLSTHCNAEEFFTQILTHYKSHSPDMYLKVYNRLEEVRKRGRKRLAIG